MDGLAVRLPETGGLGAGIPARRALRRRPYQTRGLDLSEPVRTGRPGAEMTGRELLETISDQHSGSAAAVIITREEGGR